MTELDSHTRQLVIATHLSPVQEAAVRLAPSHTHNPCSCQLCPER